MNPESCLILYIGSQAQGSTSSHRVESLRRLGARVFVVDPEESLASRLRFKNAFHYRTGYRWLQSSLLRALAEDPELLELRPDLIWVNGGEMLGISVLKWLRSCFSCLIVLYQNDDPTGSRDGNRFVSLIRTLSFYDICVLVRPETELEVLANGALRTVRVMMSYDEINHAPPSPQQISRPESVVAFIGTLIQGEHRDDFLINLLQEGLPLRLFGNLWHRSRHWPLLQSIHQGPGLSGDAYAQALSTPAVAIGLLSHQNRDLITTRSLEIPACGGLLCGERTSEHQLLYEDGHEALLWASVDECISQCRKVLSDLSLRNEICINGFRHIHQVGVGNEDVCSQILAVI